MVGFKVTLLVLATLCDLSYSAHMDPATKLLRCKESIENQVKDLNCMNSRINNVFTKCFNEVAAPVVKQNLESYAFERYCLKGIRRDPLEGMPRDPLDAKMVACVTEGAPNHSDILKVCTKEREQKDKISNSTF